jgi:two-component system, NtrC family, sensor kinase
MKMNILVVDDEEEMVESLRIGLESNGYRVFGALNGELALDHLIRGDHRIDLLITDYLMPTINGLDLVAAVRRSHPSLLIMIMTAYAEPSLLIEALKSHCDSFIEKPFSLDKLVVEIERIKLYLLKNTKSSDLHHLLPRIVHQLNNPLTAISGYAQMIQRTLHGDMPLQKYAEQILAAVGQISLINKEIMNAGRAEERKCEPVQLDVLLKECLEIFQGLFALKGVQVTTTISGDEIWVNGDRSGLEQVFKNLILNAVDAMDGRSDKKLSAAITVLPDSPLVEIVVEDTGCGIREDLLAKIFDPYFTEKQNGNGLGLEIIKNVVESHNGEVFVESEVEIGSKFCIHLPAMEMV